MKIDTNNEVFKEARKTKSKAMSEIVGKGIGIFLITNILMGIFVFLSNALIFKMPIEEFEISSEFMIQQLLTTGLLTAALMINTKLQKEKLVTLGFTKHDIVKEYFKGILIGILTMFAVVLIGVLTGSMNIKYNSDFLTKTNLIIFGSSFIGFLIQGMSEEVFVRGYMLVQGARKKKNVNKAIYLTSFIFAALHLLNPGTTLLSMFNLFLFGMLTSLLFIKSGNIWLVSAFHSIWNFLQGNFFGILVSGQKIQGTLLMTTFNEKMKLLNGGSFGAEGGLIVTVINSIAILILLKEFSKKDKEEA